MERFETAVIGGGAAGLLAAISAGRRGVPVVICEKTSQLGKKLLATGNGRCNLLNTNLDEFHFNAAARGLVSSIFAIFDRDRMLGLFQELGLEVYSDEGRVFPRTNQASSVLKVIELELKRLPVAVKYNFDCASINHAKSGFIVAARSGEKVDCRRVVLAAGGRTYPAFGADGGAYEIARKLGHTIVEPVPVAVPLVVKDNLCHLLQGQKILAVARSMINGQPGVEYSGEVLFTKYGLSGTCILDASEEVSIALTRKHRTQVFIAVDLVPFISREKLAGELQRRRDKGLPPADLLTGILPNKFGPALQGILENSDVAVIVESLKNHLFRVADTRGWNEAEFTAGGVAVDEVAPGTLESKLKKGIYFAGEMLDVNGERGGYNLAWAWASGWVAGAAD
ncbi:aminoacetone oxidase family FAD-binding enzyme [Dehalogenimonas alkenigignens]|uniref:Flavoprotein, HI0933 family n=1 Tax=Dehalogenimonas alkenigignens TaxID=1217799 RepID=A0A0W0GH94_9CHLR|nr:aminoacetone oxidase family FAD-binding enzyme [Dehalogenimonas alkenigignens]KTB47927.1 flavoprotein, HI0933 family [Dehalogenimonas alkenigignens]PVV82510.1 aminoacetone oxidase family FAD-binding enzyme [Dehalogenimonas alkenigignens]